MWGPSTLGAGVGVRATDTETIVVEPDAVARPKLRQGGSGNAREKTFVGIYKRRTIIQNSIRGKLIDGVADYACVNG